MGGPPGFEEDVDSDDEREKERRARIPQKVGFKACSDFMGVFMGVCVLSVVRKRV